MSGSKDFADSSFRETRWTLVRNLLAGSEERRTALEALCAIYRQPLYHFARRSGLSPEDADDVVQEFLANVIRRETFEKAAKEKGRMRTFLLAGLRQQIADWFRRHSAMKRGGAVTITSLEESPTPHTLDEETPDRVFARKWAQVIRTEVVKALHEKWTASGRQAHIDALLPFLLEPLDSENRERLAAELGTTASNVGVMLHRFRRQFATSVRTAVADTVSTAEEIEDELRELGIIFSR